MKTYIVVEVGRYAHNIVFVTNDFASAEARAKKIPSPVDGISAEVQEWVDGAWNDEWYYNHREE